MESEEIIMIVLLSIIGFIVVLLHMCCAFSTGFKEGISIIILGFGVIGFMSYISYILFKASYLMLEKGKYTYQILYIVFGMILSVCSIGYLIITYIYIGDCEDDDNEYYYMLKTLSYPIIFIYKKMYKIRFIYI